MVFFLTIAGCKNILTNVSSSRKRVDLLMQIPEGAIPVAGGFFTKSRFIDLPPFTTTKPPVTYYFYFPKPSGETPFTHFPLNVASDETGTFSSFGIFNLVSDCTRFSCYIYGSESQDDAWQEVMVIYLADGK